MIDPKEAEALIASLESLARFEHADLSIGDEAATMIRALLAEREAAFRLIVPTSPRAEPPPGTVRVRIPVLADTHGRMLMYGQYRPKNGWTFEYEKNWQAVAWITADIPIPNAPEIPGTVETH